MILIIRSLCSILILSYKEVESSNAIVEATTKKPTGSPL
uniref:Uncharacterized protein n=1 Tax=Rhizophora mucronata TaxID=61149 RepID=A0A2P2KUL7_RHIMU